MVKLRVAVPPAESVTLTVNEDVPVVVGVPEITPVDELRVKPAGSDPLAMAQVVYEPVPPEAAKVSEYALPTTPYGRELVVMATAE